MENFEPKKSIWKILGIFFGVIILLAVVFLIFLLIKYNGKLPFFQTSKDEITKSLPSCGNRKDFFTALPVKDSDFKSIVPLGSFSPWVGHIFPIKHTYWMGVADKLEDQTDVNVYVPGDGWVTSIEKDKNSDPNFKDVFVFFSPCNEVQAYFFHFNTLSPKLEAAFQNPHCETVDDTGKGQVTKCSSDVKIEVKAGELMGIANGKAKKINQLFDFGMFDSRTPELEFANKSRWQNNDGFDLLHMVCPYDYYSTELKQKILPKMGDMEGKNFRTAEPICGAYMQDVKNTAQGVWFSPGTDSKEENKQLTLSRHYINTEKGIFVVGFSLEESGLENDAYDFDSQHNGMVNRDFKEVKSDGKIYCYEPGVFNTSGGKYGLRILLSMPTPTTLKIEGQKTESCSSEPWEFSERAKTMER